MGARRLVLRVDTLPAPGLSKNARRSAGAAHWSLQSKAVREERERAGGLVRKAWEDSDAPLIEPKAMFGESPVSVTFSVCFGDRRRRDLDGWAASTSVWLDALVDLGLIPDDSIRYVRRVSYAVREGKEQGMEITIEEER